MKKPRSFWSEAFFIWLAVDTLLFQETCLIQPAGVLIDGLQ